jgi:hypothetical protein
MKRLNLILFSIILSQSFVFSQGCLPEGIIFTTQEQIDSFEVNYPGCSVIEGDVFIQGSTINNLDGLFALHAIGGNLLIGGSENLGTSLTDLEGLYFVSTIGGNLSIEFNPLLNNLTGLDNLDPESIQSLTIYSNPLLFLCDVPSICSYLEIPGAQAYIANNSPDCNSPENVLIDCGNNCLPEGIFFSSQQQIDDFQNNYPGCTEITGYVTINGDDIWNLQGLNVITTLHKRLLIGELYPTSCNPNLQNLSGLENLTYIGSFLGLEWSTSLQNCTGLNNLQHIRGYLKLWGNGNLNSMDGLGNLTSIGQFLDIRLNESLENLTGLENLNSIGEQLVIYYNPSLQNLTGLGSLNSIGGYFYIGENNSLNDLTGLNSNYPLTIASNELSIVNNPSLNICAVPQICNFLSDSITMVEIYNNAQGCDSPEQVIEKCHTCLTNGIIFNTQNQIDSFQIMYPECWYINGNVSILGYNNISNLNGLNGIVRIEGDLIIKNNYNLFHLTGLENLSDIWGDMIVRENTMLIDFTGIEKLSNVGEFLAISDNEHLISLKGMDNINLNSIYSLMIENNPLLSKCDINSICEYLLYQEYGEIYNNATGCNSVEEVEQLCFTSLEDTFMEEISISPNPSTKSITITIQQDLFIEQVIIYNQLGQKILETKPVNKMMDISKLKPGIYFIEVITSGNHARTKLVVE